MSRLGLLLFFLPLVLADSASNRYRWDTECGQSKYPDAGEDDRARIVGGIEARQYEFPWQVSLRGSNGISHSCGGVLINKNTVLTAAHCTINNELDDMRIMMGEHNRSADDPAEHLVELTRNIIHEDYIGWVDDYNHDIALLTLAEEAVISEDVFPVCAPEADNLYEHYMSQASGWGTLWSGGPLPQVLQWVNMTVLTNEECNYENLDGRISDNMVCAGDLPNDDRDTCQGDSGGPLTVKIDGTFSVIGLTSWGFGCASGTPGVYTRVSRYLDWIDANIDP